MRTHTLTIWVSVRKKPLAACLSAAFALSATNLQADSSWPEIPFSDAAGLKIAPNVPSANSWPVTNCADDGPDSLRSVIAAPTTLDGDTVDLTQVPVGCSAITLSTGAITVTQADLFLVDTATRPSQLQIVGDNGTTDRVINHTGSGTLSISGLTVANGYYLNTVAASGGCIQSHGSVTLLSSSVANCAAVATNGNARGGGIVAAGSVSLLNSLVTGCTAKATDLNQQAAGGGIYAYGGVATKYSALKGNKAMVSGSSAYHSSGGGMAISGGPVWLYSSTVSENEAELGSAMILPVGVSSGTISNSTVSDNTSTAITIGSYVPLTLQNSTVAHNHASSRFGGVYIGGTSLSMQSSIVANNSEGPNSDPSDLHVSTLGSSSISGADNLVMMATGLPLPAGVVSFTTDPKLGPLQFNGGKTETRALLSGSPAIGTGNNAGILDWDQRGNGYPRTTNGSADIGAIQFDPIFRSGFDFD